MKGMIVGSIAYARRRAAGVRPRQALAQITRGPVAISAAGLVLAGAAPVPAEAKIYIHEFRIGGPADIRHKPSSLRLPPLSSEVGSMVVRNVSWRNWGSRRVIGKGRLRVGDPDNGFKTFRVRLKPSVLRRSGCSDNAGTGPRAYRRVSVRGAKLLGARPLRFNLFGC